MQRFKKKKQIFLIGSIFTTLALTTSIVNAGTFGAEIFCTMRDGGNDHENSWEAAYTYIKQQKGGIFKVSPKRAASQITESVVRDKENFSYCVEYLDKLHPNRKLLKDLQKYYSDQCNKNHIDYVPLTTKQSLNMALTEYLKKRTRLN